MSTSSERTILYIGASRGVGFAAYKTLNTTLVQPTDTHTFRSVLLLRSPPGFEKSVEAAKPAIPKGVRDRTELVKGDAHSQADVHAAFEKAGDSLDTVVFSIGFTPPDDFMNMMKAMVTGFKIDPADLCTRGLCTVLRELDLVYKAGRQPKLIVVSSMGMGKAAHQLLPFMLKGMYTLMLEHPHADKIGMEAALERALISSQTDPAHHFFPAVSEVLPHILPASSFSPDDAAASSAVAAPDATTYLPSNFLPAKNVCVVRPALLTDGEEKGWKEYRKVQEGPAIKAEKKGMYGISRADAGGFIARLIYGKTSVAEGSEDTSEFWGQQPVLAY